MLSQLYITNLPNAIPTPFFYEDQLSTSSSISGESNTPLKFKTEKCKYYLANQECPFSFNCMFAHGEEQLQSRTDLPTNYRTKKCLNYSQKGYCHYGTRCQFQHSHKSSKLALPNLKYTFDLETIQLKNTNFNQSQRLSTLKNITIQQ